MFFHRLADIAHADMGIDFSAAGYIMTGQQNRLKYTAYPFLAGKL